MGLGGLDLQFIKGRGAQVLFEQFIGGLFGIYLEGTVLDLISELGDFVFTDVRNLVQFGTSVLDSLGCV